MKTTSLSIKILMIWVAMSCQTVFAQTSTSAAAAGQSASNEKIVRSYYTAFVNKDWNLMNQILDSAFTFTSPVDDHINLKAFKERCWPNAYKIKRCDIEHLVVNGDFAFVIYNGWTTDGKLFRNSDYFKIEDGKIKAYECFFGPGVNYPNSGK